jgi:hypothetical protein
MKKNNSHMRLPTGPACRSLAKRLSTEELTEAIGFSVTLLPDTESEGVSEMKKYQPKQIVEKLRQADVELGKGYSRGDR